MESCIFCKIIEDSMPSSKVFEDDICVAFMDIQPVNPGHVLVVPKVHSKDLSDLPADTGAHLFQVAQRVALHIPETNVKCEGINLLLAHREAAGQDVFHVHFHIIPRFKGDGFGLKFGQSYANLPERSELDAIAAQIKGQLEK